MEKQTYYLLYKITNLLNGMIYIGVHKTQNKDDSYMGSGRKIKLAIKEFGIKNFKKTILKECKSQKELFLEESLIVNKKFVKRKDTYNSMIGGKGGWDHMKGKVVVKDKKGNIFSVDKTNKKYLNGNLVINTKGKVTVKNSKGEIFQVSIKDPRYLSKELVGINTGKVNVEDLSGKRFQVNKNDKRIGKTLFYCTFNNFSKHSEETKKTIGEKNSISQLGKRNSQFGTIWITNEKVNLKIKKEDKIPKGFRRGIFYSEELKQKWNSENKFKQNLGKIFITNGSLNKTILKKAKIPKGFKKGRTRVKDLKK